MDYNDYSYFIHQILVKKAKGDPLTEDDIHSVIASKIHLKHIKTACTLIRALMGETTIDGIVDCAGYFPDQFCDIFGIDESKYERWVDKGINEEETKALIYCIVYDELEGDIYNDELDIFWHLTSHIDDWDHMDWGD